MNIYCGNNANHPELVNGIKTLGSRYSCLQKGKQYGYSQPFDPNFLLPYQPIDKTVKYCGNSSNLPDGYTRFGGLYECYLKGMGVGKKLKANNYNSNSLPPVPPNSPEFDISFNSISDIKDISESGMSSDRSDRSDRSGMSSMSDRSDRSGMSSRSDRSSDRSDRSDRSGMSSGRSDRSDMSSRSDRSSDRSDRSDRSGMSSGRSDRSDRSVMSDRYGMSGMSDMSQNKKYIIGIIIFILGFSLFFIGMYYGKPSIIINKTYENEEQIDWSKFIPYLISFSVIFSVLVYFFIKYL